MHESQIAEQLIKAVPQAENFIADKGYDSDKIRDNARENGITPVIPRRLNAKKANPEFDKYLYKLRHLVENLFARLKHFRSIATRFEKLTRNYRSILALACTFICLNGFFMVYP